MTVDRAIAAPAETVRTLVSDVTQMGEWSPEAVGAEWLGGATGPTVGACFKGSNQRGRRRWSTKAEVVEAEPGRTGYSERRTAPGRVRAWRPAASVPTRSASSNVTPMKAAISPGTTTGSGTTPRFVA